MPNYNVEHKFRVSDYPKAALKALTIIEHDDEGNMTEENKTQYTQLLESICNTNWTDLTSLKNKDKVSGYCDLEDIKKPTFKKLKKILEQSNAPFIIYNKPKGYEFNLHGQYQNTDEQPQYFNNYAEHANQMRTHRWKAGQATKKDSQVLAQRKEQTKKGRTNKTSSNNCQNNNYSDFDIDNESNYRLHNIGYQSRLGNDRVTTQVMSVHERKRQKRHVLFIGNNIDDTIL